MSGAAASEAPGEAAPAEGRARAPLRATPARLRTAGFKSFADATVVEALRWAMGETSARSMRGGEGA